MLMFKVFFLFCWCDSWHRQRSWIQRLKGLYWSQTLGSSECQAYFFLKIFRFFDRYAELWYPTRWSYASSPSPYALEQLNLKPFSVLHTKMLFIKDFWFEGIFPSFIAIIRQPYDPDGHSDLRWSLSKPPSLFYSNIEVQEYFRFPSFLQFNRWVHQWYCSVLYWCCNGLSFPLYPKTLSDYRYALVLLSMNPLDTYITFDGILNFFTQIYKHGGTLQLDRLIYNGYSKGTGIEFDGMNKRLENQRARFISSMWYLWWFYALDPPADAIKNGMMNLLFL